jgi:hypothetical protein
MGRYFYDCEFLEDGSTIDLISIAIVCEDGRELYAINQDADWYRISKHPWLMKNVVPHLPARLDRMPGLMPHREDTLVLDPSLWHRGEIKTRAKIAEWVEAFITGDRAENELWADFGAYDHVALCQLFGTMMDLPPGIPMWTHDLQQIWEQAGRPALPATEFVQHDALDDARRLKAQYDALTRISEEELHASFYRSEQYKESATERAARELAEADEVCTCTPAWCRLRCPVCMDLRGDMECPGGETG